MKSPMWRYLGKPTQPHTVALGTAKGSNLDCDPHIHQLLLQHLPRAAGLGWRTITQDAAPSQILLQLQKPGLQGLLPS